MSDRAGVDPRTRRCRIRRDQFPAQEDAVIDVVVTGEGCGYGRAFWVGSVEKSGGR
jgi:hypothetical protein